VINVLRVVTWPVWGLVPRLARLRARRAQWVSLRLHGELVMPENEMHTTGYWLTVPRQVMRELPFSLEARTDGAVAPIGKLFGGG